MWTIPLRFNNKNNCYIKFGKCLLDVADLRRGCFGDEGLWQDSEGKIHEDKEQSGFEPVWTEEKYDHHEFKSYHAAADVAWTNLAHDWSLPSMRQQDWKAG